MSLPITTELTMVAETIDSLIEMTPVRLRPAYQLCSQHLVDISEHIEEHMTAEAEAEAEAENTLKCVPSAIKR